MQLGQELTQKMNEDLQDGEGDGGSGDDEEVDGDGMGASSSSSGRRAVSNHASRAIASLLSENMNSSSSATEAAEVPEGRYKKLFEMDFMKRAAEQQREKAREDAQSILRELEQMEDEEGYASSDAEGGGGEEAELQRPRISQQRMSQAKLEVKAMLGGGSSSSSGGSMTLNIGAASRRKGKVLAGSIDLGGSSNNPSSSAASHDDETDAAMAEEEEQEEANPWLQPVASTSSSSSSSKKRKASGTGVKASTSSSSNNEEVFINTLEMQSANASTTAAAGKKSKNTATGNVAVVIPSITSSNGKKDKSGKQNEPSSSFVEPTFTSAGTAVKGKGSAAAAVVGEKAAVKISLSEGRSQAELVQAAFAGPDLEAEFSAYKRQEIDAEHGIDEKRLKIISDGEFGACECVF